MNRNNEFDALLHELEHTPNALEGTVARAKRKVRSRRRRWLALPGSAAALFAVFILLVNTSSTFASEVKDVPIIGSLASALRFSDPISTAIKNGYYQPVGESQTVGDITMSLDYTIADRTELNLIYSAYCVEYPNARFRVSGVELTHDGSFAYSVFFSSSSEPNVIPIRLRNGTLPEQITVHLTLEAVPNSADWLTAEALATSDFTFDLSIDPQFRISEQIYPIGQWLELNGNRV